jgi:diguanylate cyclase (GGDEF)-like protein
VAEKIRERIEQYPFRTTSGIIHCTISFGVATYNQSYTMLELINIADAKLYKAKEAGKNRIEC